MRPVNRALVIGGLAYAAFYFLNRPSSTTQAPGPLAAQLGGAGNTPYGQNPPRTPTTPQMPPATINALLPATTQGAFAAYPRSTILQGPNA